VKITAIIATFNEERHIGSCLHGILRQKDVDDFEILVIDGRSTDRTVDIVRSFPEFGTTIRLIENPRRLQVYAWNVGWRAARGEYIAFIGAHSVYDPYYLRECLNAMERTGATAVGPVQTAEGTSPFGKAVAWCMTSPFGVGNARFRFTREEEEVESVFSMFLRRETLERLGGYDERVAFDEDDEFNYRLREAGGRIFVSPKLRVRYYVRDSLLGLWRQMMCYGYWRRFTRILHPQQIPWRVYAPPAAVAGMALSVLLVLTPWRALGAIVPAAYLAFVLVATAVASAKIGFASATYVPLALGTMHLAYGVGYWRALFTPPRRILVRKVAHS
jgi:glycosyltransferase involved in cell wall biosynthesis